MLEEINLAFGDGGLLSQHVKGYAPRPQQQEMASTIAEALSNSTVLIAEAGTGTGKTFAYLVPAILSGQKVIISTGTKNLQDQLFSKDIPTLRKALAMPFQAALLKGRSNYLCHYRLHQAQHDPLLVPHSDTLYDLMIWSGETRSGDLSEDDLLEDSSPLWPRVTSTIDNCLGSDCPNSAECFISEARKKAQEADIVVVNHHLLMSDMALKSTGQGEVLPNADAYIIDEAHQLPDIATQFLGDRISSHQIQELCRDTVREMAQDAADMSLLQDHADKTESALRAFRLSLGDKEQRTPWMTMLERIGVENKLTDLIEAMEDLAQQLGLAAERGKGLEQCHTRSKALLETLHFFDQQQDDALLVLWTDIRQSGMTLHATPHNISEYFQQWIDQKPQSWIFTSATLTVAGKFNNFSHQLGLSEADTIVWPSPFDFEKQSLLYMPMIPVDPNHDNYLTHIIQICKDMIAYSQGRIFLLFTSYRSLNKVADALADIDYPLMIQGRGSKMSLLSEFREHGNAVLLGTNSFWEGVDVRGEALSCVLIDKIPFSAPDDPILQAKIEHLKQRGGNPFTSIQIPSAVIQLKQGIGRLIRDQSDYGVLVLCDPRFLTKPYGKHFLRSLPPMPITQDKADVELFFKARETTATA
jgi:ATP-dependent DNA helicase DinG